jgi:cytochrome c556
VQEQETEVLTVGRQPAKWNKAAKFKVAMEAYKAEQNDLYRKVGRQHVQFDSLKKKLHILHQNSNSQHKALEVISVNYRGFYTGICL